MTDILVFIIKMHMKLTTTTTTIIHNNSFMVNTLIYIQHIDIIYIIIIIYVFFSYWKMKSTLSYTLLLLLKCITFIYISLKSITTIIILHNNSFKVIS